MKIEQLEILFQQKKYKKLLAVSTKVKSIAIGDKYKVCFFKAECHRLLENYEKAIFEYYNCINSSESKVGLIKLYGLIAHCYIELKKPLLAIDIYKAILNLDRRSSTLKFRHLLSGMLFNIREFDEAETYAKKLLSYEDFYCEGYYILINCSLKKNEKAAALNLLNKFSFNILKIKPKYVFFIIHTLMKLNEFDLSANLIGTVKSKYNEEKWLHVLAGLQAYEQKQYKESILICRSIKVESLPNWLVSKTLQIKTLAQSLEKLKFYNESFKCYQFMSELNVNLYKNFKVSDYVKENEKLDFNKLPTAIVKLNNIQPVFMLGFPRSGTTLLETVLDTHPDIITMSEPPTISTVIHFLNNNFAQKYPRCLTQLTVEDIENLRSLYFNEVKKLNGGFVSKECLIDKMPINTIHLPLIHILFPDAKIILNIRHPLDVIYSCFQQQFQINNEMIFLISLKDCVERYKQVMHFFDEFSSKVKLDFIVFKYENFIDNMEDEYKSLLNFLSLPVNNSYKNFAEHAKSKIVNTSSKNQVTKPLYTSSKFKWTNYYDILEPFFEDIRWVVNKYDYTL